MEPMLFHELIKAHARGRDRYLELERYFANRDEARRRRRERMRRALGWIRAPHVLDATAVRVTPTVAEQAWTSRHSSAA